MDEGDRLSIGMLLDIISRDTWHRLDMNCLQAMHLQVYGVFVDCYMGVMVGVEESGVGWRWGISGCSHPCLDHMTPSYSTGMSSYRPGGTVI